MNMWYHSTTHVNAAHAGCLFPVERGSLHAGAIRRGQMRLCAVICFAGQLRRGSFLGASASVSGSCFFCDENVKHG